MNIIILIKILALIYSTIIFVFGGLFITIILDNYIFKYINDESDNIINRKTTLRHFLETIFILSIIAVFSYIGRNILHTISFPLDGYQDFNYLNVKEISSGFFITFIILNFSYVLNRKFSILKNRFITLY